MLDSGKGEADGDEADEGVEKGENDTGRRINLIPQVLVNFIDHDDG